MTVENIPGQYIPLVLCRGGGAINCNLRAKVTMTPAWETNNLCGALSAALRNPGQRHTMSMNALQRIPLGT